MRRRHILLGTLTLAVVVATIGGVGYALHARAQAQADETPYPGLHAPVSVVCPGPTSSTNSRGGLRAIRPRNDCTPSFTQQDVRDYLANGVTQGAIWTSAGSPPAATRVIFLTIRDLGLAPGDIGRWECLPTGCPAPDTLVCYAGLTGTFAIGGGNVHWKPRRTPVYVFDPLGRAMFSERASIVFDAYTGNQLASGLGAPLG